MEFRNKHDCGIDRNCPGYPDAAVLYDDDGNVRVFPRFWTDAQIWAALEFANTAFAAGVTFGEGQKVRQIRAVLGLPVT